MRRTEGAASPRGGFRTMPPGLGLGCWEFSDIGTGAPRDEESIRTIREARDMGIVHFDTAQSYGDGHSESVVGAALEGAPGVLVASKSHPTDKQGAAQTVQESLRRLRRSSLDLFYIHWPRTGFDLRPMMEGLEQLRSRGVIRMIGVSNFSVADMENASQAGHIDVYQACYNLLWRFPERQVIPYCMAHGISLVTYSTIAQGLLSDTPRAPGSFARGDARANTVYYRPDVWPGVRDIVRDMQAVARQAGLPLSTLAIRWVLSRPGVTSVLVGSRSVAQIRDNVDAVASPLPPDAEKQLTALSEEAGKRLPDVGNIFLFYP
jgi:myo-inositol catabolism protein IolS